MKSLKPASLVLIVLFAIGIVPVRAQSTAFTYQGRLRDNSIPAVGVFDLRFALYDAPSVGTRVGSFVTADDIAVTNGLFCVVLDFGVSAFTGADRWLETSLRPGAESGDYTVLIPRRALTATPYALYALNAGTAANVPAVNLTGTVPLVRLPGEIVTNNEVGLTLSGTFSGNGASMTDVNADLLDGQHGAFYLNAANLTAGTLSDARLSPNVSFLTANQVFSGSNMFAGASLFGGAAQMTNTGNLVVGTHAGDGASLSNLTAASMTGTAPIATNFSGWLMGDVTGTQSNTAVAKVGGVTAANVASGATLANAALSANAANTIVKRDGSGNFAAGTVTATFSGDGSALTNLNASHLASGTLADDRLSSSVTSGINAANAASSANTPNAIVRRDAVGSFAAGTVIGAFVGDGSGLSNINASSIVGGGGSISLPSGMTVVSALANDPALTASGYRMIMTVPTPGWANGSAVNAPSARSRHTAVWDGHRLIIWGGKITAGATFATSGGMYYPDSDLWETVSLISAPAARANHTAIWSGTEMIIWGGDGASAWLNTGAGFSPDKQEWRAVTALGAPAGRSGHIAVWTGMRMLIWGGRNASGELDDGAMFDPAANQWSILALPNPPDARARASAVWAGDRVIIWGGEGSSGVLSSGSQLLFANGEPTQWLPLASASAPTARRGHTAVWTGQKMIVWGGEAGGVPTGGGAAFDPAANTWGTLPSVGSPVARFNHAAAWTGQEMLIVGGSAIATELASGSAYDPGSASWWGLSSAGSPQARTEATASWTGTEVLVFGGRAQGQYVSALQRLVPQPVWHFYRKL